MKTPDLLRPSLLAALDLFGTGFTLTENVPTADAACTVAINVSGVCNDCTVVIGVTAPTTCTGSCTVSVGVPLSGQTPGGSCGGDCLVSVGDCYGLGFCEVSVNFCNGDCTVNVGFCSVLGGKCLVTVGECYSVCTVNVGTCRANCTVNVGTCPSGTNCTLHVGGCILLPVARVDAVEGGDAETSVAGPAAQETPAAVLALLP